MVENNSNRDFEDLMFILDRYVRIISDTYTTDKKLIYMRDMIYEYNQIRECIQKDLARYTILKQFKYVIDSYVKSYPEAFDEIYALNRNNVTTLERMAIDIYKCHTDLYKEMTYNICGRSDIYKTYEKEENI